MDKIKYLFLLLFVANVSMAKNIGHRLGGDIYKPENTLYCYKQLIKHSLHDKKLKDIEFDVRETKDKKIVVFHDSKIKRVVPKTKYNLQVLSKILERKKFSKIRIRDLKLNTIKRLRLEHNATIPTLKEVLEFSKNNRINLPIHIDIKNFKSDKTREQFIKTIINYKSSLNIRLQAFRKNFYKSFPNTKIWIKKFYNSKLSVYQIEPYDFVLNSDFAN